MAVDASIYNLVKPVDTSPLMQGLQQMAQKPDVEAARQARGVQNQRSKLQLSADQEQLAGQVGSETLMSAAPLLEQGDTAGALQLFASGRQRLEQAGITPPPSPIMQMLERGDVENAKKVINAQMQRMQGQQGIPSGLAEFQGMVSGLSPEEQEKARRVKLGLDPRAVGSGSITTATTGLTDQVAASEGRIAGSKAGQSEAAKLGAQFEQAPQVEAAKEDAKIRARNDAEKDINQPKARAKLNSTIRKTDKIIGQVEDALADVSFATAGGMGALMSAVRGTPAYDLRQSVMTIKANLGFDTLQEMRDNSPTGGALGAVAAQELESLQATVSSLDIGQSPQQLMDNLDLIKEHYKNYKQAVQASYNDAYSGADSQASEATSSPDIDAELQALEQELGL